jgi:hypothetical protein
VAKLTTTFIATALLLPFGALAQQAPQATPQDELAACNTSSSEILSVMSRLRAQITADQREIAALNDKLKTAAPAK